MLAADSDRQIDRERMVDRHIIPAGVQDPTVLAAMRRVPRHRFVPETESAQAYEDYPLPIGYGQTVSQPSLVGLMIEALKLSGDEKVLEVGTGSGYQAALLAEVATAVFTIEIVEPLAQQARKTLAELGYSRVHVRTGDGYRGWPEDAPFDAIVVSAAPDHIPQALLEQLAIGGRLILPVGRFLQRLVLVRRTQAGYERTKLGFVRFVPMTGGGEARVPNP